MIAYEACGAAAIVFKIIYLVAEAERRALGRSSIERVRAGHCGEL